MVVVLGTWVAALAVTVGCGCLSRRAIARCVGLETSASVVAADIWIGLTAALTVTQAWSLVSGVSGEAVIALITAGGAGLALGRPRHAFTGFERRRALAIGGVTCVVVTWLANIALGPVTSYDSALYHLGAIEYTAEFGTIPGLGNLHDRMASNVAHFSLAASFDTGPWSGAGFHLPNGFLVFALVVDVAQRAARRNGDRESTTRLFGVFLGFGALALAAADPFPRVASPSIDLPVFVLVAASALYLGRCVERRGDLASGMAACAAGGAACASRPILGTSALALGLCVVVVTRPGARPRTATGISILPAALGTVWLVRQVVLSGYPLFPLRFLSVDVDWRMPAQAVDAYARTTRAWAREPGADPDYVLGGWGWVPGWLARTAVDVDVIAACLVLVVALVAAMILRRPADAARRASRKRFLTCLLGVQLFALVPVWVVAPDMRFVWGPIWVSVAAIAAWALAASRVESDLRLERHVVNALGVCAFSVLAVYVRADHPTVIPDGRGPFGTPAVRVPLVVDYETATGLRIVQPRADDRCYRVLLCTPQPRRELRLRTDRLADGLAIGEAGPASVEPSGAGARFRRCLPGSRS